MSTPEPIYSHDMERALLGALMIDPRGYVDVADKLDAADFYIKRHGWIYEAIAEQAQNGGADFVNVVDYLRRSDMLGKVGGVEEISGLVDDVVIIGVAKSYAQRIREDAHRRRLEEAGRDVWRAARDVESDVGEVQSRAESAVIKARREGRSGYAQISEVASREMDLITEWAENPLGEGEVRGLPTGLRALDGMLGGLMPGYYLLAGRPSMGKTALLLQILDGLCNAGVPCLLFSIEMSDQENTRRIACRRAGISKRRLERGDVTPEEYSDIVEQLGVIGDWPLVICDDSTVRPMDVLAKARRFIIENGELGAVFLDGIWLMTPEERRENRTQTVGSISRDVKRVQRELDIPIVAAHQLSRSCEHRKDKRPLLSDLRDSGDLEQDADVVMMLYRDDYYDPETEDANIAEVWIRKNRLGGPTGTLAKFFWRARLMQFLPLETRAANDCPIDL